MKKDEVPQHQAKAFMGRSKALYALDEQGRQVLTPSNGWEAEEIVLDQAIEEFVNAAADAWKRAKSGQSSPLEYHMYHQRMDVVVLSQSTGFFQWQVKRHLKPQHFNGLSAAKKELYADALGLKLEVLLALPEKP